MELEEAIKFCEEHECEECPMTEKRTEFEKKALQIPCCFNLLDIYKNREERLFDYEFDPSEIVKPDDNLTMSYEPVDDIPSEYETVLKTDKVLCGPDISEYNKFKSLLSRARKIDETRKGE